MVDPWQASADANGVMFRDPDAKLAALHSTENIPAFSGVHFARCLDKLCLETRKVGGKAAITIEVGRSPADLARLVDLMRANARRKGMDGCNLGLIKQRWNTSNP